MIYSAYSDAGYEYQRTVTYVTTHLYGEGDVIVVITIDFFK